MKQAYAVIGANFGDEGKGLITDFLAADFGSDAVIVRYNGGAQAGHTVVDPSGKRHVFSHFGSGSFSGANSFLSRFFVCNPLLFVKEYNVLSKKINLPKIFIDELSPITTPFDMMINQIVEEYRGNKRHGSCGMGFGETIERQQFNPYMLVYKDLDDKKRLKEKLELISKEWVKKRLGILGVKEISEEWKSRIFSEGLINNFIKDIDMFLSLTTKATKNFLQNTKQQIIFEGAQGLLLDQDRGHFPHVTRSNTGLKNISILAEEARITDLEVNYITRAYMTRHGAGPLNYELKAAPYKNIKDETNIDNDYQGSLRFGWLDSDLLARSISDDLSDKRESFNLKQGLVVTCLDQVDEDISFIDNGSIVTNNKNEFLENLRAKTKSEFTRTSSSPSRESIYII